jgi:hypothetical protein
MPNYKHIGRIKTNKRRCIVAYRVVPGDSDHCLIIQTESLSADEHDSLIKLVESPAGQEAYEFAEAMARSRLPDGRNMLAGFHATGKIQKVKTDLVEMTPNAMTVIGLKDLNETIATQRGVTVDELAVKGPGGETVVTQKDEPIDPVATYVAETKTAPTAEPTYTPEELASKMRGQADAMFKEAKRLREMAEELSPTKRKNSTEVV